MSKTLPPLPHWCEPGSPFAEQMQAYATAAVEALRAQIGRGVLDALDNFEKKERSPLQAYLLAGMVNELVNELRTALIVSTTPAPQTSIVDDNSPSDLDYSPPGRGVDGFETPSRAGVVVFCTYPKCQTTGMRCSGPCSQANGSDTSTTPAPQEPLGFISPKQVERIVDPDGAFGAYIPMRKTSAGNFTLPLYAHPAPQPYESTVNLYSLARKG